MMMVNAAVLDSKSVYPVEISTEMMIKLLKGKWCSEKGQGKINLSS